MSRPVSVAITSVYGGDTPSTGLVAAQMLRRQQVMDVRIIVLATEAFGDGIFGVHAADRVVVIPPLARDPEGFFAEVRRLRQEVGQLVLLPGSAGDTIALAPWQPALQRAGVRTVLPRAARLRELPFPATGRPVRAPKHLVVAGPSLGQALRRPWRYPVVVRWADGRAAWAYGPTDLHAILYAAPAGATAGIHETVPGIEFAVTTMTAGTTPGGLVAARPLNVSESGVVWSAVTVATPRLVGDARRTLAALRWTGPAEARFVQDDRGRLWFTGLTPGFPSWVSLSAAAGQDLVIEYVRLALGLRPSRGTNFASDVLLARVSVDDSTTIDALRQLVVQGEINHEATHARYLRTPTHPSARAAVAG